MFTDCTHTRLVDIGWCQGALRKLAADGSPVAYCLIGAVSDGDLPLNEIEYEAIRRIARRICGLRVAPTQCMRWNDTPGRTREEVVGVIDSAIMALDGIDNDAS